MPPLPPDSELEEDLTSLSKLEQVERLRNILVAHARGERFAGGYSAYRTLRGELQKDATVYAKLPDCVKTCGTIGQFRGFIQSNWITWRETRVVYTSDRILGGLRE